MSLIIDGSNGLTFPNSTTQASAGSVIQVVNATYSTVTSNSTNTYADTGLTATITPKFSTSKILIIVNHTEVYKSAGNANSSVIFNICKNGTQIVQVGSAVNYTGTSLDLVTSYSTTYVDSPATTSATTYKTQFKNALSASTVLVQNNSIPSTITLMEIAA